MQASLPEQHAACGCFQTLPEPSWYKLLDSPRAEDVLVDYEGGTWIATFGRGAYRLRALHLTRLGEGSVVRMRHTPSGDVLFTTESGVWRYRDDETPSAPEFEIRGSGSREVMAWKGGLAISNGPSLMTYDAKTARRLRTDPTASRDYLASHQERNWWSGLALVGDTLWGSTYGHGIRRFWPGGLDTLDLTDGLPDTIVEGLTMLGTDVWILTRGSGAGVYNSGRIHTWNTERGLPSDVIFSAYRDTRGDTWLGTDQGAALIHGDSVRTFEASGLAGSRLLAFFERPADPGAVWGVTGSALVRFDTSSDSKRPVQVLGGFDLTTTRDASVTEALYLPDRDRLLVGTTEGLVAAELSMLRSVVAPRVAFTSALVDGADVPMRRTPSGEFELGELLDGVREVSVTFAPVAFQDRLARAEYRLDGGEWRDGSARSLTFAPPRPGRHHVDVRAIGGDGHTLPQVRRLAFAVLPSWWQTLWARILGGFTLVGLSVGAARWATSIRYRRQVRELEAQARVQRERQRISRDLHDHVGSQLTGLIAGLELAQHDRSMAQVEGLRSEARNALSQLRRTVWALGTRSGNTSQLAREIERHVAEQSRFITHPRLAFEADVLIVHALTTTEALHLVRIAQEAVQNALKHAHADAIAVRVQANASGVCVSVVDDGAFVPPGAHSGSGLSYVRERAAEIGAHVTLEGGEEGTHMEVRLARP